MDLNGKEHSVHIATTLWTRVSANTNIFYNSNICQYQYAADEDFYSSTQLQNSHPPEDEEPKSKNDRPGDDGTLRSV